MSLKRQIELLVDAEDILGIDTLVKQMGVSISIQTKNKLADAYLDIYHTGFYDLACSKIKQGFEKKFIESLLELLDKAESLNNTLDLSSSRGMCFQELASFEKSKNRKLLCINKAIETYKIWLNRKPERKGNQYYLAEALIIRLNNVKKIEDKDLHEILDLYTLSISQGNQIGFESFLNTSFDLLNLSFEKKIHLRIMAHMKNVRTHFFKIVF